MTREAAATFSISDMTLELDAVRAGDPDAFGHLYERYQSIVLAASYTVLGDWSLAEDACQDTFVKVHGSLARYTPGTNFQAWLMTIAYNTAIDLLRKRRQVVPVPEDLAAREVDLGARHGFEELLRPLNAEEKYLVVLKYFAELQYGDLARLTGKAEGSLRNQISLCLRKLRGFLAR